MIRVIATTIPNYAVYDSTSDYARCDSRDYCTAKNAHSLYVLRKSDFMSNEEYKRARRQRDDLPES